MAAIIMTAPIGKQIGTPEIRDGMSGIPARPNRSCRGATSPGTSPSSEAEKNQNSRPVLPLLSTDPKRGV
jgi:hypothetical protein